VVVVVVEEARLQGRLCLSAICGSSRGTRWCCSSSSEVAEVSTVGGVLEDEVKPESEREPVSESESNERERVTGNAGIDMVYSVRSRC